MATEIAQWSSSPPPLGSCALLYYSVDSDSPAHAAVKRLDILVVDT